jgi:hypothetical protein
MMEIDVVTEEQPTKPSMAQSPVKQGLAARYDEMRADHRQHEQEDFRGDGSLPSDHQRCVFRAKRSTAFIFAIASAI